MGFEVRVRLTDLKRAFRRLLSRLPDEMDAGNDFTVFRTGESSLEVVAGETSEALKAVILHSGHAIAPVSVLHGIARALRHYRGMTVTILLRGPRSESIGPNSAIQTSPSRQ